MLRASISQHLICAHRRHAVPATPLDCIDEDWLHMPDSGHHKQVSPKSTEPKSAVHVTSCQYLARSGIRPF